MAMQIARNNREWGEHLRAMPQEEVEVYVLFVNTTNRTVDLYWVRDPDTENIQRLFFPVRIRVPRNPQQPEELCDVRSQILIHFPLRTLRDNCLWLIVRWLKRTYDAPREYINSYMIPVTLKQQMHILLNTIEAYCSQANQMRRRMRNRR
ncbi:protein Vhl isoform X2 [Drosophila novamexicana]|uniref:protein Vhl isoform X2 n=1 Tax=Drosophila novamexicana TaxID=47314 RepID=UPI0011E5C00F|nr:protein Vhl isoform X2 [Drosophila novamexicana]